MHRLRGPRVASWSLALLLTASCRTLPDSPTPGWVDHHVHVLSPALVRDWKAIGATFSKPDEHYTDVAALFERSDLAGALLVPMAHFYGNEELRGGLGLDLEQEVARVRAENDFVAALAARDPHRRIALASVDLLRPYAMEELERARRELGLVGAKVHLASAGFDLRDPTHLQALEQVVAWVAREDDLLLLHLETQRDEVTGDDIRKCLDVAFGPHPNVRVIVAHLGGSGGFGSRTRLVLDTCAQWLEREAELGRPRDGFHFDLSAVPMVRESEGVPATNAEQLAKIAPALRRVGVHRLLFGSDFPVFDPAEHARVLTTGVALTAEEVELLRLARVREFTRR